VSDGAPRGPRSGKTARHPHVRDEPIAVEHLWYRGARVGWWVRCAVGARPRPGSDLGLGQVKKHGYEPTTAHTLYNLIDRRHGRASTAVSSNIALSDWGRYPPW